MNHQIGHFFGCNVIVNITFLSNQEVLGEGNLHITTATIRVITSLLMKRYIIYRELDEASVKLDGDSV